MNIYSIWHWSYHHYEGKHAEIIYYADVDAIFLRSEL